MSWPSANYYSPERVWPNLPQKQILGRRNYTGFTGLVQVLVDSAPRGERGKQGEIIQVSVFLISHSRWLHYGAFLGASSKSFQPPKEKE